MTSDSYSARARALIQLGRYQEAASVAREGLASAPDDHVLHRMLAIALSKLGDKREALKHATSAVQLNGSGFDHTLLGQILVYAGRHEEGVDALRRGVALSPMDPYSHQSLAEGLIKWGGARKIGAQAIIQEARASAETAMAIDPVDPASHMVLAKAFLFLKDLDSAEQYARSGLAIEPNNHVGHQLLGVIADNRGDVKAAGEHFVTAAKANPGSSNSLKMLRNVRGKSIVAVIIAYVVLRLLFRGAANAARAGGAGGGWIFLIIIVGIAIALAIRFYGPRWAARRKLGEQAKSVLEADRQLRRKQR